jgi:hypothetical protein
VPPRYPLNETWYKKENPRLIQASKTAVNSDVHHGSSVTAVFFTSGRSVVTGV